MPVVSVATRTLTVVDELIILWQEETKSEDTSALVARSAIDTLLDLRAVASEFGSLDIKKPKVK